MYSGCNIAYVCYTIIISLLYNVPYIDWNEVDGYFGDGFLQKKIEVLCKHTKRWFAKFLKRHYAISVRIWSFCGAHFPAFGKDHIPSNFLKAIFHKFYLVHSWIRCLIYSGKIIKGFLKKCWQICYKSTEKFSAKIRTCSAETRRRFLQKYWKVFCKLLTGVPRSEYKINNFLVKIQGLGLFPATSILF